MRWVVATVVLVVAAVWWAPGADAHHKPGHNHGKPTTTTVATTTTTAPTTTTTPPVGCGGTMGVTVTRAQLTSTAGPVTITQGGTYSGFYRSTDPSVPAVTINTTSLVEFDHACFEHAGIGLYVSLDNAKLDVHDSTFQKLASAPGAAYPGNRSIYVYGATRLNVDYNLMVDGDGTFWQQGANAPTQGSFRNNKVYNVGRYLPDSLVNAYQTNALTLGGLEVSWNEIHNEPLKSDIEDTINFYQSHGTVGNPIVAHHNLVDGGYPPTLGPQAYNGVGVLLSDSEGSYQHSHHNTIVRYSNAGPSAPTGDHLEINDNVTVCSGLANGVPTGPDYGNGVTFWHNASYAVEITDSSLHDNVTGYNRVNGDSSRTRSDYFTPMCGINGNTCTNNTSMPAGLITTTDEQDAVDDWEAARIAAGVTTGPR